MSEKEDMQADSTWTTLPTPPTPEATSEQTYEDHDSCEELSRPSTPGAFMEESLKTHLSINDSVDRDLVDREMVEDTTSEPKVYSCVVEETTAQPPRSSIEDPVVLGNSPERRTDDPHQIVEGQVVLEAGLERKIEDTPRRSSPPIHISDLVEAFNNTPTGVGRVRDLKDKITVIPHDMEDEDITDPRSTSPTTSTPSNTPTSSSTNMLKEMDQSAVGEEDIDDEIVFNMMNISLSGKRDENLYEDTLNDDDDDSLWEATGGNISIPSTIPKSSMAKRTRSHKSLRDVNLTELCGDLPTNPLEDTTLPMEINAVDSMEIHTTNKSETDWGNKKNWYEKLNKLNSSLVRANKMIGPRMQMEMITICNKKTAHLIKENEEMGAPPREGEDKKVTFIVDEPPHTTAIKEVVKTLEAMLEMNLQDAPLKNVENIIKIILSICLDYSDQAQMVQETLDSMARLIKELLVLKGRMVKMEKDNALLKVDNTIAEKKILYLNKLADESYKLTRSMIRTEGEERDLTKELTALRTECNRLRQIEREQLLKIRDTEKTKGKYWKEISSLNKTITDMDKGRKIERYDDRELLKQKDDRIEDLKRECERLREMASNAEESMEEMNRTYEKNMSKYKDDQALTNEKMNEEKAKLARDMEKQEKEAKKEVDSLKEQIENLKKARSNMNVILRDKDKEINEIEAEAEESRKTLIARDEEIKSLKGGLKSQEETIRKSKDDLKTLKLESRMLGNKSTVNQNPVHTERINTPMGAEGGLESDTNTHKASFADLNSSTNVNWADTSSNLDTTQDQNIENTEASNRKKSEKRKKSEDKISEETTKPTGTRPREVNLSSEESSPSQKSDASRGSTKRRRQDRSKDTTQKDVSDKEEVEKLKKRMEEKDRQHKQELETLEEKLQQARIEARPAEVGGSRGGVQEPMISSQEPREAKIVAVTKENIKFVSSKMKGLLLNPDGTLSMTLQFKVWMSNQEVQMEETYDIAPPHPEDICTVGLPPPTRRKLIWTHKGKWIDMPYSTYAKGPLTVVARVERSINTDGIIVSSISFGDEDVKLKVWYDAEEIEAAFKDWNIPDPGLYFNTKKHNPNKKVPKGETKPPPPPPPQARGRGGYQNSRGRGRGRGGGGSGRWNEEFDRWDRQQSGGGQHHQQQGPVPPQMIYQTPNQQGQHQQQQQHPQQQQYMHQQGPVPQQVLYQNPNQQQQYQQQGHGVPQGAQGLPPQQYPMYNQQGYHQATASVPAPVQHQYHLPTPLSGDQQHYPYQYSEEGGRSKDYQGQYRSEREYSRERKPVRPSRDPMRRDSGNRESRRFSSESDYDRRRYDEPQDRRHRDKSRRRGERSPSPPNSGIGRGGGRRERDHSSRREEGKGRGRDTNQDRSGSDASYGKS